MKKIFLCLLLVLVLSTGAFALEVPTDTTVQNLNGSQQLIKTYTLSPDTDPQELIEAPFEQEGFLYTFADIVKSENLVQDQKYHVEQVTLDTDTNSLGAVLELFASTLDYDDGEYSGTLALDHNGILIEPSGYTTKTKTVSATRTIGPVDRNDMSYVPSTTVQNGLTLKLSNVDWQVIGTDVVGDSLAPTTYQAVATYTGQQSSKVATGYVATVEYCGNVYHSGVESITYKVKYLGTDAAEAVEASKAAAVVSEGQTEEKETGDRSILTPIQEIDPSIKETFLSIFSVLSKILSVIGVAAALILAILLIRSRQEVRRLQDPEDIGSSDDEEDEEEMEEDIE